MFRLLVSTVALASILFGAANRQLAFGDEYSPGASIAQWIDAEFSEATSEIELCDDLTFVRRVYLDSVGRIPGVSETRDFMAVEEDQRRDWVIEKLLYPTDKYADETLQTSAEHWARIWRRILLPPALVDGPPAMQMETWLATQFAEDIPFDQVSRDLATPASSDGGRALYTASGASPQAYVTQVARGMLGVRIHCAQCHDHPFTEWKQEDFWGMAAYYSGGVEGSSGGSISHEGKSYPAKTLWDATPAKSDKRDPASFAQWLTSEGNPQFAASAVNRIWAQLVGRGMFAEANDLDTATEQEREMLDGLAVKFRESGYGLRTLVAGIMKSRAYQIAANPVDRPLKVLAPEQVFFSLERALLLPVGRINELSARHNGRRLQMLSRLSEAIGDRPDDYAAGIPQALLLMNGPMTTDAVSLERSRLLRAVVEAPYFDDHEKLKTLYLAVLTREPSEEEQSELKSYLDAKKTDAERKTAHGEILWALINSPEFVLCR